MDWTINEFEGANHNPIAVVNGDKTKDPIFVKARIGRPVTLSAMGSEDPDGHKLAYHWFHYQEAASAISRPVSAEEIIGERGEDQLDMLPKVKIENSHSEEVTAVPQSSGVAHIILAVEDNGVPSLTSYRRVILEID